MITEYYLQCLKELENNPNIVFVDYQTKKELANFSQRKLMFTQEDILELGGIKLSDVDDSMRARFIKEAVDFPLPIVFYKAERPNLNLQNSLNSLVFPFLKQHFPGFTPNFITAIFDCFLFWSSRKQSQCKDYKNKFLVLS